MRSVVSAPVLIWTKWTSGGESIPASSIARRTPSAATLACPAVPNSSGSRSRVYAVPTVKRFCPRGAPRSGWRVKIVACGLITPSVPPDQMMGTCRATSSSFRPERSAMSIWKDSVASARVKSLTPPLPSVLPRTATTCSARKAPASSRSEEHTSELQSQSNLVCRLLLEKKKTQSACTAEIVCDLMHSLDVAPSISIAETLYVGLVTDTDKFMYENTCTRAHRMSAELIAD